jgi:hypothetical protein
MTRSGCPIWRLRRCATTAGARTPSIGSTGCFGSRCSGGWRYEDVNDADRLALDPVMRQDRNGLKYVVLNMDSSVSPTHGDQEGAAWNGHFDCTCYHPNFLFNKFGMLERCALRNGNVHSADG